MTALPELSDQLLKSLRKTYFQADPTLVTVNEPAVDAGLRAVYQRLQELATPDAELLAVKPRQLAPLPADPQTGPWDVIVQRRTGEAFEPVRLLVEAAAALGLAFHGADLGAIRMVDAGTGHLTVERLPWEETVGLYEGTETLADLQVGYRVIVPPLPADTAA